LLKVGKLAFSTSTDSNMIPSELVNGYGHSRRACCLRL